MRVLMYILFGFLAMLGGCTVLVGGCSVGVVKAGLSLAKTQVAHQTQEHFDADPRRFEKSYRTAATQCYTQSMEPFVPGLPASVVQGRVDFDVYAFKINNAGDPQNIQYIPEWRAQKHKELVANVGDKATRKAVKAYFKRADDHRLKEAMCLWEALGLDRDA